MMGLSFVMSLRGVSQSDIATYIGVTPQTVNKWVKGIRNVPDKYKETLGQLLNVNPFFLERELTTSDMIFLLSGEKVEEYESHSIEIQTMKKEYEQMRKKTERLEKRIQKIEEESNHLVSKATLLKHHLYVIEDEQMKFVAKDMMEGIDRIQQIAKGEKLL